MPQSFRLIASNEKYQGTFSLIKCHTLFFSPFELLLFTFCRENPKITTTHAGGCFHKKIACGGSLPLFWGMAENHGHSDLQICAPLRSWYAVFNLHQPCQPIGFKGKHLLICCLWPPPLLSLIFALSVCTHAKGRHMLLGCVSLHEALSQFTIQHHAALQLPTQTAQIPLTNYQFIFGIHFSMRCV